MSLWARAGMMAGGALAAYYGIKKQPEGMDKQQPKPNEPESALTREMKKRIPTENLSQRDQLKLSEEDAAR